MNNELEMMWKEVVMTKFKVHLLSRHFPGGTEENNENIQSG
jgi:hypothetical protein